MTLSRRGFLRCAASLPAGVFGLQARALFAKARARGKHCLVLDSQCVESLQGYVEGLRATNTPFEVAVRRFAAHASVVIAPTASLNSFPNARWLRIQAQAGATVLVESGGGFVSTSQFRKEQWLLSSQFKVTLAQPAKLWEKSGGLRELPYIDLTWPKPARVRDFSQVAALDASEADIIGRMGDCIVAVKRRLGNGRLIVLGSPLGPHLLAGDPEAQGWLEAFCNQASP